MPCNSDYQNPTNFEKNLSDVLYFLKEVKNGNKVNPDKIGKGYNKEVYNQGLGKETLDKKTEELCTLLQTKSDEEIQSYSLEIQIWWRNHKIADEKRIKKEIESLQSDKEREEALKKLTPHERKLLNLD